jgi:hypothetical protein
MISFFPAMLIYRPFSSSRPRLLAQCYDAQNLCFANSVNCYDGDTQHNHNNHSILSLVFTVSPILSVFIDSLTRLVWNLSHREGAIQHNTAPPGKISRPETCRSFQFRGFVAHRLRQCSLACKEITRIIWRYCSNNPQFAVLQQLPRISRYFKDQRPRNDVS